MIGSIVLDRYEIDAFIADGGMGRVYRARHTRLGSPVAVKVLGLDAHEHRGRMEREALLAARVRHPNVVSILDFGELGDGSPCIVMEYVTGTALDKVLAETGAMPWQDASRLARYILAGLGAIHDAGILHRDLKPSNVLISGTGPRSTKLIDFGIALEAGGFGADERRFTAPGSIVGTPVNLAPEQLTAGAEVTERSDLYSVGLLLAECITGRAARTGSSLSQLVAAAGRPVTDLVPPEHLPALPPAIGWLVRRLTDPEPGRRPASADEALELVLSATSGSNGTVRTRELHWSASFHVPSATLVDGRSAAGDIGFAATAENTSDVEGLPGAPLDPLDELTRETTSKSWDRAVTRLRVAAVEAAPDGSPSDALLVALLETGLLDSLTEMDWLADIARLVGYGFRWEERYWCAYLRSDTGLSPALTYQALSKLLRERFGVRVHEITWVDVPHDVRVSTGQFAQHGMPASLRNLLDRAPRRLTFAADGPLQP